MRIRIRIAEADIPPRCVTVGQRWRWKRNLTIVLAWRAGISQRWLADVFDLPRSRIASILGETEERAGEMR